MAHPRSLEPPSSRSVDRIEACFEIGEMTCASYCSYPHPWQLSPWHLVWVGNPLPGDVQVVEIPKYKKYKYAYVNKKRVVIDSATGKVIAVY